MPPKVVVTPGALLEPEPDNWENDSAVGDGDDGDSTASLASSILRYRQENGRTYHAYKEGKYSFPNDESELDRLDLQHHLFTLTFRGKLFTAPIPKEQQLHQVLDVGCGTGIWSLDFGDDHPESKVIGVDLSPIQPNFVAPNVVFQIDDLEEDWTFSEKFDFIYSRMFVGSVADFARFFQQSYDNLNPGGWIEMADVLFPIHCDDHTMPESSALVKWSRLWMEALAKIGRPAESPALYSEQMKAVGFSKVEETVYKWPSNKWPRDKYYKELGLWGCENFTSGLEGLTLRLFTGALGWSREEVDVFLVDVRKDMKDTKMHSYWNIHVVTAQKPLDT